MDLECGALQFKRVEYLSLPVPPELLGLTASQVTKLNWQGTPWVAGEQIVISAAAWFLETAGKKIVFDPIQAVDVVLRSDTATELQHQKDLGLKFEEAGFHPETIDLVLMTHIEGVGAVAKREQGTWLPFFPNAKVLVSEDQLADFKASPVDDNDPTNVCWRSLLDHGVVGTYRDGEEIVPGVIAELTNAHGPGHSVFHFGPEPTTFIGHLAVSALHLATGPCEELNLDAAQTFEVLHRLAADGRKLIGPLWPAPGVGIWENECVQAYV